MKFFKDPIEQLLYISLAVLMLIIVLSGLGVAVRYHEDQQQTKALEQVVKQEDTHLDCVALLLTKPNRSDLRIQDLNNCKIGP